MDRFAEKFNFFSLFMATVLCKKAVFAHDKTFVCFN